MASRPRTPEHAHSHATTHVQVLDGLRALPAATSADTGAPLYSQRVKIVEYERILGSVDVPNSYFAFRVGPVLLGCFMPPEVSACPVSMSMCICPVSMPMCICLVSMRATLGCVCQESGLLTFERTDHVASENVTALNTLCKLLLLGFSLLLDRRGRGLMAACMFAAVVT